VAGLLTTGATSSPYSAVVPGQCRWRPEGHRDLVRTAARAASTPTVAMATTPPPVTTKVCPTPLLSLMPRQDPATPDLTYAVAITNTTIICCTILSVAPLSIGNRKE
jgi:hypothetical protein